MIIRILQRAKDDCAICVVAMIMGPPYSYERVREHSRKYPQTTPDGIFSAWWETYLRVEGFDVCYCRIDGLQALAYYGGEILGMLGMDVPRLRAAHIVGWTNSAS